MNWDEALEEIQSVEFDFTLNVVSGTNAFFRAVANEPAVLEAYHQMRESGELREDALGRLFDLASREIDPLYENPNDTALAVLLWLTYFAAGDFVPMAAATVARVPNCWYANKFARRILNPPPSSTENHRTGEILDAPTPKSFSSANMKSTIGFAGTRPSKFYRAKPSGVSTVTLATSPRPRQTSTVVNHFRSGSRSQVAKGAS